MDEVNTKLDQAMQRLKKAREQANQPKHEAWVPYPEKERAKEMGVRWNGAIKRFEFAAENPKDHPCARYLPSNYTPLKAQIPFAEINTFKELGVVTTKADGKWQCFVMTDIAYERLIEGLVELELL